MYTDERDRGFLIAALTGDKSSLSENDRRLFQEGGISHLMAISGLHVSIMGMSVYRMMRRRFSRGISAITGTFFLLIYTVFTGSGVSTLRAAVMLLAAFLAESKNRSYDMLSAAGLAGTMILMYEPYQLFSAGFILSFLAVISIGGPGRILSDHYRFEGLRESFLMSLTIQMTMLPVSAYFFFRVPVYAPLVNILVLPLMTVVVFSGLGAMGLSFLSVPAGRFAGGAGHYLIKLFAFLCEITEMLPGHSILVGRPSFLHIAMYYVLLAGFVIAVHLAKPLPRRMLCTLLLCGMALQMVHFPGRGSEVTFLSVGQGDCIVIRDEGRCLLVDCGSSSEKNVGSRILLPYLESEAINEPDMIFLTHGDTDHISGVKELLEEGYFQNTVLVVSAASENDRAIQEILKTARNRGLPIQPMGQGDRVDLDGGAFITCLWPDESGAALEKNEQSLVLLYERDDFRVLLMGDAGKESEEKISEHLHQKGLHKNVDSAGEDSSSKTNTGYAVTDTLGEMTGVEPVSILKCGHHGSSTSTGEELIETVRPAYAVLSYGEGNRYGHPHRETVALLKEHHIPMAQTAIGGAQIFTYKNGKIRYRSFKHILQ